jgi:putative acetyltransferase
MTIRPSSPAESDEICTLHENAFGEPEGRTVAELVRNLMDDETAVPTLSLVMADGGEITGHIFFSSVTIDNCDRVSVSILAPLAVAKSHQKKGIGKKLIESGLADLKESGTDVVLVLGDPAYYSRFGFHTCHTIQPPYELPYPEAWMAVELQKGTLKKLKGMAYCADSLQARELW